MVLVAFGIKPRQSKLSGLVVQQMVQGLLTQALVHKKSWLNMERSLVTKRMLMRLELNQRLRLIRLIALETKVLVVI